MTTPVRMLARLRVPLGFVFAVAVLWLAQPTRAVARLGRADRGDRRSAADLGGRAPQQVARGDVVGSVSLDWPILCTSDRRSWAQDSRLRRTASALPSLIAIYLGDDDHRGDPERGSVSARTVRRSLRSAIGAAIRAPVAGHADSAFRQAIANREHRAVTGLLLAVLLLVLKATYNGVFWRAGAGR